MGRKRFFAVVHFAACLLLVSVSHIGHAESLKLQKDKETVVPNPAIVDKDLALSDREELLVNRLDSASLDGNFDLVLNYYRSLMRSFIVRDAQANILAYSLKLFPKLIAYEDYSFATQLLAHLKYRLLYYAKEPPALKKKHTNLIWEYSVLLNLLPHKELFQPFPPQEDRKKLQEQVKDTEYTANSLLVHLILGLTGAPNSLDDSLQDLYIALDIANSTHNTEMYYTISTILIEVYIKHQWYSSALVRLNFLYTLFASTRFSNYYRAHILLGFVRVYLLQNDMNNAYMAYLRTKDALKYNSTMSTNGILKLENQLSPFIPQFTEYAKNHADGDENFLDQFIDANPDQADASVD